MQKDNWEPCPRCGSNKVESKGLAFFLMLGVGFIGISIFLLIFPPVGITGIITGLAFIVISPFTKGILQCKYCKKSWKIKKA